MKMCLQEVLKMDEEPFDEDVVSSLCHPDIMMSYRDQSVLASLVSKYFLKFGEKYGIDLSYSIPNLYYELENDEDIDELHWNYLAESLFSDAAQALGWQICFFNLENLDLLDEFERAKEKGGKEVLDKLFRDELEKRDVDINVKEMLVRETDMIYDSGKYMDYGYCVFLWNDKLSDYLSYEGNEQIKNMCKKESAKISSLMEKIWQPYMYNYNDSVGEVNGSHYLCCQMGSDGQSYVEDGAFNPNWVCKAFILDKLLDLALEKIHKGNIEKVAA